jgi:hypothetical protein
MTSAGPALDRAVLLFPWRRGRVAPKERTMQRFLVERTFPGGLEVKTNAAGAQSCLGIVQNNAEEGVTWVTSYVSADRTKTYCVYDGPSADAIRRAAQANALPVDSVNEVRVLDPYFYTASEGVG